MLSKAIQQIEKHGVLLVFPVKNQTEPKSLWSCIYPRTAMRWEWSEDGDDRVVKMWHLMKKLSERKEVVYSKWYQGRATFFSREVFCVLLALQKLVHSGQLSRTAREILETLQSDSPLSTKQLKEAVNLQGKDNAAMYDRSVRELFRAFKIVGCGELEDGAFPSLLIGATSLIFEDLYRDSAGLNRKNAEKTLNQFLPMASAFRKFYDKTR